MVGAKNFKRGRGQQSVVLSASAPTSYKNFSSTNIYTLLDKN